MGRPRKKDNTKELILNKMYDLSVDYGLNISIKYLVEEIGITETAFYNHFLNKEDLFFQCFSEIQKEFAENVIYPTYTKTNVKEVTWKFFNDYCDFFIARQNKLSFYGAYVNSKYISRKLSVIDYNEKYHIEDFIKYTKLKDYEAFDKGELVSMVNSTLFNSAVHFSKNPEYDTENRRKYIYKMLVETLINEEN